jgi:nucleoside 2-deoxyribosyltransferase
MLEGLPTVSASCVVYDPQSETEIVRPSDFIRESKKLAIVLNERELQRLTGRMDPKEGAHALIAEQKAAVVIVKQGPFGCTVVDRTGVYAVPAYPSGTVFKIGSGDVFSAAFAKYWAVDELGPLEAAQNASRCASIYCESKSVDAVTVVNETTWIPREKRQCPVAYLAGPFFSLSQRFLVEEARRSLSSLNVEVFSPFHDVGTEKSPEVIANEDIKGLERSTVVLALFPDLDPGTIFEIGYARARNIPVVAYTEGIKDEHLTMLIGSNCICSEDFCSALYQTVWAGM